MKRTVKSVVAVLLAGAASFGEAGTLPEGYLPVKCLISNGSQVIDTGVPPGPTTRMTMDFELTQIPTANMYCGFGGNSWKNFFCGATANGFCVDVAEVSGEWFVPGDDGNPLPLDTNRHVFDIASGHQLFDGREFATTSFSTQFGSGCPLYLFARRIQWGSSDSGMKAKLYGCKIYDGETLVRDFVPCLRLADKVAILYDVENGGEYASIDGKNTLFGYEELKGVVIYHSRSADFTATGFSPAVGKSPGVGARTCTAPEGEQTTADGRYKYTVTGWKLTVLDGEGQATVTTGEGTTCSFTIPDEGSAELYWQLATTVLTQPEPLPAEYRELKCIVSDGKQYVNTGVLAVPTTRMVVDFARTENSTAGLIGGLEANGSHRFFGGVSDSGFYASVADVNATWGVTDAAGVAVPLDTERHVFDLASTSQRFDDREFADSRYAFSTSGNMTLYLFARRIQWGACDSAIKAKLYGCKIYEGATLVRDFVPCVRVADGECLLYDRVEGKTYSNIGTGDFKGEELKGVVIYHSRSADFTATGFSPAVGKSPGVGARTCTAPKGEQTTTDGKYKYTVTGWKLTVLDGAGGATVTTGEGTTCSFTIPDEGSAELYWQLATTVLTQPEPLPAEYRELKCIVSDGRQYVDTGTLVTPATRMVLDFARTDGSSAGTLGGLEVNGNHFFFGGMTADGFVALLADVNDTKTVTDAAGVAVPLDTERHVFDLACNCQRFDDREFSDLKYTFSSSGGATLFLFARRTWWIDCFDQAKAKLYGCKIYDGATLVRDFVPCVRVADGECMLYDRVEGAPYPNIGKGGFTGEELDGVTISHAYDDRVALTGCEPSVGLSPGTGVRTCTAPEDEQTSPDGKCKYTVSGWKLTLISDSGVRQVTTGEGATCTFAIPDRWKAELEWQLAMKFRLTVVAAEGGSVSWTEKWVEDGGRVTLTATPDDAYGFTGWTGAPANADASAGAIGLVVTGPLELTANFGGVYYVAPAGADGASDENPGTASQPFATIAAAVAKAKADGKKTEIRLQSGLHQPAETVTLDFPVILRSATGVKESARISAGGVRQVFLLNHADAVLRDVTVEDGYQNQKQGAGVEVTAGALVNCVVRNCTGVGGSRGMVYLGGDNASCFNCVLTNYKGSAYGGGQRPGGCLCVTQGKAANCFISDGHADPGVDLWGPGLRIDGGLVANCTIVGNRSTHDGAVFAVGGKVYNCLIWDNACDGGGETGYDVVFPADTNGNYIKDRLSVLDTCVARYAPNDTCLAADDVPATGAFWTPLPGSAVIDVGADLDWLPQTDLNGNLRKVGEKVDVGCCEYQDDVAAVAFTASPREGLVPFTVTFTANVAKVTAASYVWNFGDGTEAEMTEEPFVTHEYRTAGAFRPAVAAGGLVSDPRLVSAIPKVMKVVDGNPDAAFPFDTEANAAASVQEALDRAIDGCVIELTPGAAHRLCGTLVVGKNVTIRGAGATPDETLFAAVDPGVSGVSFDDAEFVLNSARARFENLTIKSVYANGIKGVSIGVSGGTITNCALTGSACEALVRNMSSLGVVTHCVITNAAVTGRTGGGIRPRGLIVDQSGKGRYSNLLIAGNTYTPAEWFPFCFVRGTMENCTMVSNNLQIGSISDWDGAFGGISGSGCVVRHVYLYGAGAKAENCIFAGNMTNGISVLSLNMSADAGGFGGSVGDREVFNGTAAAPELAAIAATEIIFKNPAKGDWRLRGNSPARDVVRKNALPDGLPAVDLKGNPRVFGTGLDAGCYECQAGGFVIEVR